MCQMYISFVDMILGFTEEWRGLLISLYLRFNDPRNLLVFMMEPVSLSILFLIKIFHGLKINSLFTKNNYYSELKIYFHIFILKFALF